MRVYYRDLGKNQGTLVATHELDKAPDPSVYGSDVKTFDMDGIDVPRIGDPPGEGFYDKRPIVVPAQSFETLRAAAKAKAFTLVSDAGNSVTAQYPQAEMLSWSTKDAAARAYLADQPLTETQTALLQSELNAAGGDGYANMKVLCEAIVAKAETFAKICGLLAGYRSAADTALDNAKSESDLESALEQLADNIKKTLTPPT